MPLKDTLKCIMGVLGMTIPSNMRNTLISEIIDDDWHEVIGSYDLDDLCGSYVDLTMRDRAGNLSTVFNSLLDREADWFLFTCGGETKRLPVNVANSSGYEIHVREVND